MNNDNKKMIKYLGIIFVAVLLTYKLPHDSYSIIEYIIRPIQMENSIIYLSGIVLLVLYIIGLVGLFTLNHFPGKNKLLIFIVVIVLIVPVVNSSSNAVKSAYFWVTDDGLAPINLVDANVSITGITDNEVTVDVTLELIDYGRNMKNFNARMYWPESLQTFFNNEYIEFKDEYNTFGNGYELTIKKNITVQIKKNYTIDDSIISKWRWEDFNFELYNEEETINLKYHGIVFLNALEYKR